MNNKKKILFFESLSNISGGQRVLLNLLPSLKNDFDIAVVLPGRGALKDKLDELGIKTIFLNPGSYSLGKKNLWQVIKYIGFLPAYLIRCSLIVLKYDLLYVNSTRLLPMVVFANFLKRRQIIWHSHSLISDGKSLYLTELAAGKPSVKIIIAVSNYIVSAKDKLKNKTAVIYNGVDCNIFYPNSVKRDKTNDGPKQFVIIGDLIPTKGIDKLLMALSIVNSRKWNLKIIGGPRPGGESYIDELKVLTHELNISDKVEYLGRQERVADFLRQADLLILSSIVTEACPMSVLEAMASGVPVIASDLGGTREIIMEEYNGFLFEAGNEKKLAEKIDQYLALDSAKISALQINCRQEANTKYNLNISNEKIKQIIYENTPDK